MKIEQVFLFPIPGSVTFPGMCFPLHVFEPRYRKMVTRAIHEHKLLGISHIEKIIHPNKKKQDLKERLQSNQSTYKPTPIFSAGYSRLIETLKDGRLIVEVDIKTRFKIIDCIQTLPFSIYHCCELKEDLLTSTEQRLCDQQREKILHRLAAITANIPGLGQEFLHQHWFDLPLLDFSFKVISSLKLPAITAQELLEMTSTKERLDRIMSVLNN